MMGFGNRNNSSRRWRRASLVALVGLALLIGGNGISLAADDMDDEAPDTKFLRSIMKGLGLKKDGEAGIEYRERSPLVLPPGRDLPAPAAASSAKKTTGWPDDPDIKRAKEQKAASKRPLVTNPDAEDGARPALPSELNVGRSAPRRDTGGPAKSAEEAEAPSTQKELGSKSIFGRVFGPSEEYTTFAGEPARSSLTEPPRGYRTPSPHQPYGVGKEKWKPTTQGQHEEVR
jgi:hypothetical protein